MQAEYKVTLKENGRLVLPIKIREKLGVVAGDQLLFSMGDELKVTSLKASVRECQQIVKKYNVKNISLVDSLKKTRQEESNND
ncbi:MAG: AbrB/MazE/SpoVT family DNA-binding domain-containing protein [Gammaproteobacteria bacterium]|nr:AbrB/MazE/SpoVT family DNA-binding domain-containing protein [Gammaproteobacteria bacterium]